MFHVMGTDYNTDSYWDACLVADIEYVNGNTQARVVSVVDGSQDEVVEYEPSYV